MVAAGNLLLLEAKIIRVTVASIVIASNSSFAECQHYLVYRGFFLVGWNTNIIWFPMAFVVAMSNSSSLDTNIICWCFENIGGTSGAFSQKITKEWTYSTRASLICKVDQRDHECWRVACIELSSCCCAYPAVSWNYPLHDSAYVIIGERMLGLVAVRRNIS